MLSSPFASQSRVIKNLRPSNLRFSFKRNLSLSSRLVYCAVKESSKILLNILAEYIPNKDIIWLLKNIIESFSAGLPLGNLTSQLFANVYMNIFDQWAKHCLKAKHYIRYADDFVFLSRDKLWLENLISQVQKFLSEKLKLNLHPDKIFLKTIASGVDFLGWVNFPDHRILRKTTKRRMLKQIKNSPTPETSQSYLGLLKHGNTHKTKQELLREYWLWQ